MKVEDEIESEFAEGEGEFEEGELEEYGTPPDGIYYISCRVIFAQAIFQNNNESTKEFEKEIM